MSGVLNMLLAGGVAKPAAGYSAWYAPDSIQFTGGNVTSWTDKSANAVNLDTSTAFPTYTASAINGQAGCTFNGTTQFIRNTGASSLWLTTTAYTYYAIFIATAVPTSTSFRESAGVAADSSAYWGMGPGTSGTVYAGNFTTGPGYQNISQIGGVSVNLGTEMYYDGTNANLRVNGLSAGQIAMSAPDLLTGNPRTGGGASPIVFFTGSICELIFYKSVLSAGDRTTTRSYLQGKFGITM